jgi:hypothetical protein
MSITIPTSTAKEIERVFLGGGDFICARTPHDAIKVVCERLMRAAARYQEQGERTDQLKREAAASLARAAALRGFARKLERAQILVPPEEDAP